MTVDLNLSNGALARRLRASSREEPLPRAVGLHRSQAAPTVFDATGGLCRDGMVLAHLGCPVTAMERIAALAFLVEDAIEGTWLADRLQLQCGDSRHRLADWGEMPRPSIVYLDPMFDEHSSAQVKKDMQACRALAGPTEDAEALLPLALAVATGRVVVKRAPDAAPLGGTPSFAVAGERVRFDVYLLPSPA